VQELTFDVAFDRLMGNEGGLTMNPNDRGNWTSGKPGVGQLKGSKWGISAASYPDLDIKNLTRADAADIYKRDFWQQTEGLHPSLLFQMFDAAVNHGIQTSIKFLQRAVQVPADGKIGPMTLGAIGKVFVADLLMLYMAERLEFWAAIPGTEFDDGWMRRAATNLRFAAQDD